MSESLIYLEVLTPERSLYSGYARAVYIPGENGYLGVLPGHTLLITKLGVGIITCVEEDGEEIRFFCRGGSAEMSGPDLSILADVAERERDIDFERARQARERAEKRVFSGSPDVDYRRAVASLRRATERLRIAPPVQG